MRCGSTACPGRRPGVAAADAVPLMLVLVIDEAAVGRPSGPAAAAVAAYHGYRQRGVPPARHLGLPSPYLTLIFTLDDPLHDRRAGQDGAAGAAYDALAGGLHTTPALITHDGRQSGIQLQVHPHAARALFGAARGRARRRWTGDADAVLGRLAERIRNRLGEAGTWRERFAVLDDELGALVTDENARAAARRRQRVAAAAPQPRRRADRHARRRPSATAPSPLDAVRRRDRPHPQDRGAGDPLRPRPPRHPGRGAGPAGPHRRRARLRDQSHLVRDFVAFSGRVADASGWPRSSETSKPRARPAGPD